MQPTRRTKVKRVPVRGQYDLKSIYSILDDHFLCHIGFVHDDHPVVIPTLYGRYKDRLYIHGATTSRLLKSLQEGMEISLAVTHVDGLVLARSAFHHSMNYRSVVLFGKAVLVTDPQEKLKGLKAVSDQIIAHRWEEVRLPDPKELKATTVLSIPIDEASAKVRKGPPVDDKEDYELNIWAGEIPLQMSPQQAVPDPLLKEGVSISKSVSEYLEDNERNFIP
jgi:nitroimidazol reductase NimA-like FMN-containing flavoprotein (pyridoxamine 5'-phosphate oxidase superfamily)